MSLKEEKRELAKDLITLALDGGATSEERNSTAVRVIKIIRKYGLLDLSPLDGVLDHPVARAVKIVGDKIVDPEFTDSLNVLKELLGQTISRASSATKRRRR